MIWHFDTYQSILEIIPGLNADLVFEDWDGRELNPLWVRLSWAMAWAAATKKQGDKGKGLDIKNTNS